MRYIFILVILMSCHVTKKTTIYKVDSEVDQVERKAVHCLRDFITGEDAGGIWEQVGTTPQDISGLLIGDNPCFEWSDKECGLYTLRYIVGDICCKDTSVVNPLRCCLTGYSSCE